MTPWRLTHYISEERAFPFMDWYRGLEAGVVAALDTQCRLLKSRYKHWEEIPKKFVERLSKADEGLTELKFYLDVWDPRAKRDVRRRFRALGIWNEPTGEFVLVGGVEELGQNYGPTDGFLEAHRYRRAYKSGKGTTDDFRF